MFYKGSFAAFTSAALVAASFITLVSAAPSGMTLRKRGDMADDADKPKPPANPPKLPPNEYGVTGLWHLSWNTDPMTSSSSVINFDPAEYGGKAESGWGGYCLKAGDIGCLGGDDGAGHYYSFIYKCTEIDSADPDKKALVWKRNQKCGSVVSSGGAYGQGAGFTSYQTCYRDGASAKCA